VIYKGARAAWKAQDSRPILPREQDKKRLTFNREWTGHDIWVTFTDHKSGTTYRYPHDQILQTLMDQQGIIRGTRSWEENGLYHFPQLSEVQQRLLEPYIV
jgi:hypothetical protein